MNGRTEDTIVREVPASVGQRLLWMLDHYRGDSGALNEPVVFRIHGDLDVPALQQALDELIRRHEALRTTFAAQGRRLGQRVHPPRSLPLQVADLSGAPDPPAALDEAMVREVETRIDPGEWPVRARLWRVGAADHVLLLNLHHLVTDRWSNAIVAGDLGALYDRVVADGPELPEVVWQYADWSEWQRETFEQGRLRRLQEYWTAKLADGEFPALPRRAGGSSPSLGHGKYEWRHVSVKVAAALRRVGDRYRTTTFPVALAAFYAHVHRLTGQRDLAVASLFANRARPEVRQTVGFFVNMLVLRSRLDPEEPFGRLVRDVRTTAIEALAHQELPYQLLPPDTIRGETEHGPVRADDVVFQFVEGEKPAAERARLAGLDVKPIDWELRCRFALELFLAVDEDGITTLLVYDEEQFEEAWAREFVDDYVALLEAVAAASPETAVSELLVAQRA